MKKFVPAVILAVWPATLLAQTPAADCTHRTAQDYVSMTRTDRLAVYIRSLVYPDAFLYSGALAGIEQGLNRPREWGQGSLGYERRFGNEYAYHVIDHSLQDGLALGLDEDNRYFRSGLQGFGPRLAYALTSPFLARHSDGSRRLSISALSGVAGASLIQEIWQPPSTHGVGHAGRTFALDFAFRMGLDVVREFAPRAASGLVQ